MPWKQSPPEVLFTLLNTHAKIPRYSSSGAIGLDLHAVVIDLTGIPYGMHIRPGDRKLVPCGIAMAIPEGFYGRVAPRSGLAVKNGIDVLAGVIDSDYRGEIAVVLINHGQNDFVIKTGDRIAQLILERAEQAHLILAGALPETKRGENGYGSTGV